LNLRGTLVASAIILGGAAVLATAMPVSHGARAVAVGENGERAAGALGSSSQDECPGYPILDPAPQPRHSFYFTRGRYSGGGFGRGRGRGGSGWATDFEKADRQFLVVLRRLISIDAFPCENTVSFDDPAVFRFPYIYILEVGSMYLSPEEIKGMREWSDRGGFLHVDDFWGLDQYYNFELQMKQVFPEYQLVEMPFEHEVFRAVYRMKDPVMQIPSINRGCGGGPYWEQPSDINPRTMGMFDEEGRLRMVVTYNSDLGDAWEWAEQACYPVDRSTWAFQAGINFIVYAMSH
jgi:hypothetical protein